ncbi:MAG TPA: DegV family protein [Acidimicrobiales bacterium]|nr:DegV family protein [Acidimicrobiales bacterium]
MPGVKVVTDSACDLTTQMAEDRGVRVVPLTIRFGQEEFVDRQQLSTKEFWDRVTTGSVIPETAAPSPGAFRDAFLDAAAEGATGVACITLSSAVSATFQAASTAATDVSDRIPVAVVDSLSLTMGLGMLVLDAVQAAQQGASLAEVEDEILLRRDRTRVYGTIDSLEFLKRGGRIGGLSQMLGSMLSIKPVIEIRNGGVELESRQRTRQRALQYLADKARNAGPLERIAVANGAASDVDQLVSRLSGIECAHELTVTELGPVIGSHGGPGTIGLCFQLAG